MAEPVRPAKTDSAEYPEEKEFAEILLPLFPLAHGEIPAGMERTDFREIRVSTDA